MIHGIGSSSERWAPVIPSLTKYFRVIIADIVGFGKHVIYYILLWIISPFLEVDSPQTALLHFQI
ncbi:MAG: hypothetical protein WCF06_01545 [Nitrososphaeraceae archaeon]